MIKKDNPHIEYQLDFAKYLEIKNYTYKSDYKNNPLIQLYPFMKSEINIPEYTNENFNICNKLLTVCQNITDRKPINCVKIYNNSKKLICGSSIGSLIIYDIYYNDFTFSTKISAHNSSIRAIQFTKTENYLLTGDNTGIIIYFDEKMQQKNKIKAHTDKESVTDINFSISDTKFITSSDDKTSKIFDLPTGLEEITFTEHGSDVKSCDWNKFRNMVCTGSKDHLLKIWDPRSGEVICSLHPHKNTINRLRFNKNGNWLLTASKDHSLKVIDVRVMKELQIFKSHEQEVNTVCWHPIVEEMFCSAGADGNIIYWFVGQSKKYVMKNSHDKEIFDLAFNQYGNLLASGSNDTTLKFWSRKFEYN